MLVMNMKRAICPLSFVKEAEASILCPLKATEYKMRHIHKPCEVALRIDPLGYLKIRLVGVRSSLTSF